MLKLFNCDLHNHTCLSPCAGLDMHPAAIVREFLAKKLDIVAITDHNACDNVEYVMKAAAGSPLTVIPGMEVTTREEAHVLALFESLEALHKLEKKVSGSLTGENDERMFGCQAIVDETGVVVGFNKRLLFNATAISLRALTGEVHALNGLAIASHIDRPYFSVLGQLGFIPEDTRFDGLEVSQSLGIAPGRRTFPGLDGYAFITSSDSHCLSDIGRSYTRMRLGGKSLAEIRMALERKNGRCVVE